MSQGFDETRTNAAIGFSAFGGHRLDRGGDGAVAAEGAPFPLGALAELGIQDLEQVVAIAAIPGMRDELSRALGGDELQAVLDGASRVLPPHRLNVVSSRAPMQHGMGVLPPTPEMLAAHEAAAAEAMVAAGPPVALPPSVNLIPWMPPVRNQGPRGTCVAFALSALHEYVLRRGNVNVDLSEQHLYYETKLIDGAGDGCGTFQAKAVVPLQNRGECREVVWPYDPNLPCNNHGALPPQARPDALSYRLQTIAVPPNDVTAYKAQLARQRPVTVSFPVYDSWYESSETERSGRITMRLGNEPVHGGHAVCLVGYQDADGSPGGGYFIVRNSWSTAWGYQSPYGAGYGTIPYAYVTNDAFEAFTADAGVSTGADQGGGTGGTGTLDQSGTGGTGAGGAGATAVIEAGPNLRITLTA